jgi:kynurenine 3-monooxygenase
MITIVGGGPVGALAALLLARRGQRVRVFERRSDPRMAAVERGRSINLALAARGLQALEAAGVMPRIQPEMVRMPGRMLHDERGATRLLAYGQRPEEVIWSISRANLNRELIVAAAEHPLIELNFEQRCVGADAVSGLLQFRAAGSGAVREVTAELIIAADGAGSAVRQAMVDRDQCQASEERLPHDYKELLVPAAAGGGYRMEANALHIWPRGGYMLIALPNADGSFTATLFLPPEGEPGFGQLQTAAAVRAFFSAQFPDFVPLVPDLTAQFAAHPQGQLATLHCWPWHAGRALLIGDAAHAIVPFHGQGLNCGFEDCLLLVELLTRHTAASAAFREFERQRRMNTDAIAIMAIENYQEMRDTVRAADFERRRQLSSELERRFPGRFIPRYSMVMFHAEIPYADALQRGATQERLLDAMLNGNIGADSDTARALLGEAGL